MRTVVTVLALFLALSNAANYRTQSKQVIVKQETEATTAELFFYGARGFYVGYNEGIFKTEIESECLNDATVEKIIKVV